MDDKNPDEPPPGGGGKLGSNKEQDYVKQTLYYTSQDVGPFSVIIESMKVYKQTNQIDEQSSNSANSSTVTKAPENLHIGNLSPLNIAKTIMQLKLDSVVKFEKKGRNRLCVTLKDYQSANAFLKNETLLQKGYSMFIPSNQVSCKGIVRFVDRDIDMEELLKFSHVSSIIKIIGAKRLNRRVRKDDGSAEFIPTSTVQFTFSGKVLPRFVKIFNLPMPVESYVLPVIQCQHCFLYGHTKKNCNGSEKCRTCSKPLKKHIDGDCKIRCLHCFSEEHISTSKQCPEFERQKLIRQIMSFENLSFFDANTRIPKPTKNEQRYIFNPEQYPRLPKDQSENNIQISQRRICSSQPIPTYSRVTRKRTKPSSPIEIPPGYDQQAHNSCLFNPNGRLPPFPSPRRGIWKNPEPLDTRMEISDPRNQLDSILNIFDSLTVPEREHVLSELRSRVVTTEIILNSLDGSNDQQDSESIKSSY